MAPSKRIEYLLIGSLFFVVVVGCVLRLVKLEEKEFWHDECFTALVLSGHTADELKRHISRTPVRFADLVEFRTINSQSTAANVIKVLGEDEPGHAPIFYLMEYLFCSVFGTTPYSMRLLCALTSMVTLPLIYLLAKETYESKLIATLSTALASFSPLLIYYAQEARDYSLGILCMTVSNALLLYAVRKCSRTAWIIYAVSLVFSLYSWLFTAVVIGGHILYIALMHRLETKVWQPFAMAIVIAGLCFSPWLVFISIHAANFKKAYDWIQPTLSAPELLMVWLAIPYKAFALFGFKTGKLSALLLCLTILQLWSTALSAIPFKNRSYIFLSIILIWIAVFAGQDLLLGGARSAVFRYQIPIILSMLMLFPRLPKWLWSKGKLVKSSAVLLLIFVFGVELLSDTYMLNCKIWPDKAIRMRFTLPVAARLNKDPSAALVADERSTNLTELLDLSYVVEPDRSLIFITQNQPQIIPSNFSTLYLWNPNEEFETSLRKSYKIIDNVDNFPYFKRAELIETHNQ